MELNRTLSLLEFQKGVLPKWKAMPRKMVKSPGPQKKTVAI
jgi:hypothetical protein